MERNPSTLFEKFSKLNERPIFENGCPVAFPITMCTVSSISLKNYTKLKKLKFFIIYLIFFIIVQKD